MKKKKIIMIIILFIISLGLSGLLIYRNYDKTEEVIVQSNERDETKEQFKVTNEFINIRKENDSQSESLGKVYKDEIYTVLDKKEDEYYLWYQIETTNGIKGYVAVKYEEEFYIENLEVKIEENNQEKVEE